MYMYMYVYNIHVYMFMTLDETGDEYRTAANKHVCVDFDVTVQEWQ